MSQTHNIFLNKAQERVNIIRPWSYYGIIGRGGGKSTRILSQRCIDAVYSMPGSCLCFFGNSYINLGNNLVPQIVLGWKEFKYVEGWDFVVGVHPPPHFKPLKSPAPESWKHTVTWANGTIFHLGSMDRLSNVLSRSFQHFVGDEARILDYEKVSQQAFPTLRGERIRFGNAPMYGGFSFTSDMPDPESGQWLLDKASLMDEEQIELIMLNSFELNKLYLKRLDPKNVDKFNSIDKQIKYFEKELIELRHKSVYFESASTLINIDAIGLDYIDTMHESLTWSSFKSSILNILSPDIEKMFYFKLNKDMFLPTAHNFNEIDKSIIGQYKHNSRFDLHTDPRRELYAGMDFGNMNSLVLSQKFGQLEFRTIKNLHVLQPQILDDLADLFCEYYKFHLNKRLTIDYDRAGNNRMANSNKTLIEHFRDKILEKKDGWAITLRSINMRVILHSDRRFLINRLMGSVIQDGPKLTIDESNCKELKSSLTIAKVKAGTDDEKDKSSEKKRNLQMLPLYSTNYSDAYDYSIWGNFKHLLKSGVSGSISMAPKF